MKYSIQRFNGRSLVHDMSDLDLETTKGIILLVWGVVPTSFENGGDPEEEWKLSIGEGHWVIVKRTA